MPSTYADLLETLREEAAYGLDLAFLEDDARMYDLLRRTGDRIATAAEVYETSVGFSPIAGTREYPLDGGAFDRRLSQVLRVVRDGTELCGVPKTGAYRIRGAAPNGTVGHIYAAPNAILLDPPPSSTEAARAWSVMALVLPDLPQADGANAPDLPDELAEAIPLLALENAARRSTEGEQFKRIQVAIDQAREAIREFRSRSRRERYSLATPRGRWIER